jgi:hypothetical protein
METNKLIDSVESLIRKAEKSEKADEALKFSQAALNAGNAIAVICNTERARLTETKKQALSA